MLRVLLGAALMVAATGCAGRRVRQETAAALAAADARILDGCYDCLLTARATYERLASSKYMRRDTVMLRLFETELLIALREKELQLDWEPALERARALGRALPSAIDAHRLLAIADAVLPDGGGRMGDWPAALRRRLAPFVETVPREVAWLDSAPLRAPVRRYLALALDCSYGGRVLASNTPPGAPHRRPVLSPGASPLIIYRTAICLGTDTVMLQATRALVPMFPEAAYFLGSSSAFAVEETGGAEAAALFDEAHARFPRSPSVNYLRGWLRSNAGDCAAAVQAFDEAIAIDAAHELAWLQRTICLSTLKRDSAVLESATRLIALGTGFAGQGHYWRAVSHHRLRNLPAARSDIEVAKRQARTGTSLTVAGVIEHDQNDLAVAEQDLLAARADLRGDENCTAVWYLALVHRKQQRTMAAASSFEAAMKCYDIKVSDGRYRITLLESRPTRYPQVRARRIAALIADTVDNRSRYFASAYNAAGDFANAGDVSRAFQLLDIAAADPKLTDPVAKLRAAIVAAVR